MALLRVRIRGMTVELEPDDPRAKQIDALLFGPPEPEVEPEPVKKPLSPKSLAFWDDLKRTDRRMLLMLADRPRSPEELDEAFAKDAISIRVRNRRIATVARKHRYPLRVLRHGRTRSVRLYRIDDAFIDVVRRLSRTPAPS